MTSPPTRLRAYRAVLAVPSLRRLLPVAFLVRIPATATAITLTLHVVLQMGLGYAPPGWSSRRAPWAWGWARR